MSSSPYPLFSGYGIEAEYMIVGKKDLAIRPIADRLLEKASPGAGSEGEVERSGASWSNELTLHVIEMKTNGPISDFEGTAALFQSEVGEMNRLLAAEDARLLPGAMHPTMDPDREMRLWPNENDVIYKTFDRIFDCRGHGWANLQSVHINFPFRSEDDFSRLHAAIRVVLPLVPALCASSPLASGKRQKELCHRVAVYRDNAKQVPSVSGKVIPERVFSTDEYRSGLLPKIYADLRPFDPEGILAEEWVNARGAIARFDRSAIELRLMDIQECPAEDLARVELLVALVRALAEERFTPLAALSAPSEDELLPILERTIEFASRATIENSAFLRLFGETEKMSARALLAKKMRELLPESGFARKRLDAFAHSGTLAERIVEACGFPNVGEAIPEQPLGSLLGKLADCLERGEAFTCEFPRAPASPLSRLASPKSHADSHRSSIAAINHS